MLYQQIFVDLVNASIYLQKTSNFEETILIQIYLSRIKYFGKFFCTLELLNVLVSKIEEVYECIFGKLISG